MTNETSDPRPLYEECDPEHQDATGEVYPGNIYPGDMMCGAFTDAGHVYGACNPARRSVVLTMTLHRTGDTPGVAVRGATLDNVRTLLADCNIADVSVGRSRQSIDVTFADDASFERAVLHNHEVVDGRKVSVVPACERIKIDEEFIAAFGDRVKHIFAGAVAPYLSGFLEIRSMELLEWLNAFRVEFDLKPAFADRVTASSIAHNIFDLVNTQAADTWGEAEIDLEMNTAEPGACLVFHADSVVVSCHHDIDEQDATVFSHAHELVERE